MLKISNLSLPPDHDESALPIAAARYLGIPPAKLENLTILRQSIDARKKSEVRWVYSIAVDAPIPKKLPKNVSLYQPAAYSLPQAQRSLNHPPVVAGMGPAGLFAALTLARAGLPPIVLERGQPVQQRVCDVESFWTSGLLNPASNVQFGEGGAGAFSDGKLTSGINDPRISFMMDTFIAHGAPKDIRYSHKPHIGTDILRKVVSSLRGELLKLGCDIRFGHKLDGLTIENGMLRAVSVLSENDSFSIPCEALVLAPGHSASDTAQMLLDSGVALEPKPFAIGVRIEHLQTMVSSAQYGPSWTQLPPSDYKLACHLPNGRSAFSFCVCPGGQVVAAASENGKLVTNGMSYRARDGQNCNGGFLVGVSTEDFSSSHPLAGLQFQQTWEQAAFLAGGGNFIAPVQTVGDFCAGKPSRILGDVLPTYRPGVRPGDLHDCLPAFVSETLAAALPVLDRKLHGFAHPGALLTGVETRSSSPIRIPRDESFQSVSVRGLYPCGEGAGYAGGITSAAVDGVKVAEALLTGIQ